MKKYDYLLFDADNTLFDFNQAEHNAFINTAEYGGLGDTERLHSRYTVINDALWKRLERKEITLDFLKDERFRVILLEEGYPENDETLAKAADLRDRYTYELSNQTCLCDGAEEVCRKLKNSHRLYIVTNGISSIQRSRLAQCTIGDCFEGLFISEEMGVVKPSAAYFDKVLETVGERDKSKYLVIGDSLTSDCDGAIAYGLDICRYNPDGKDNDGRVLTYNIRRLTELFDIVGVQND